MTTKVLPVYKKSLFAWIFEKNRWLQFALVIVAILAVFANVFPLEMQKRIVNDAINDSNFDRLVLYCSLYLAAVISASLFKYLINVLQNVIGQRTLTDMRKALYDHLLTIPLGFYRKTQPGMVVSAVTTELATAGDFVGIAIAVPVTNVLMLLAFAGYLFWLHPLLAAVTLSIYPAVLLLVPILQKKVNRFNRKRVDAGRRVSSKVAETVDGIHEIQANGTFQIENRKFGGLVERLEKIRIFWNLYRFGIKVVNSLFTNFSRFLVFALGGYLAIEGRLELGALVAFLSAQEKLYDPWKELIQFYQAYQTASVTYDRTMAYFALDPEHALLPDGRKPYEMKGDIETRKMSFVVEDGTRLLSEVDLALKHGEHLALVGFSGSGKSTLAQCIGQLYKYSAGNILIDQREVAQLSKMDITNNVGFVSQSPFIFEGSIEENLLYAVAANEDMPPDAERLESIDLEDRIQVLKDVGLYQDVLRFGLNGKLKADEHEALIDRILELRQTFRRDHGGALSEDIEFYHPDRYLYFSNVAENILYGGSRDDAFSLERLPENEIFQQTLAETGLDKALLEAGILLADELVKLADCQLCDEELWAYDLIDPDDLIDYKKILYKAKKKGVQKLSRSEHKIILPLILKYIPQKHSFFSLSEELEGLILKGRKLFKQKIELGASDTFTFCRDSTYMYAQSILTNIFYGKLKNESSDAQQKVNSHVHKLLTEEDFLKDIVQMGLQYQVGTKGGDRKSVV